jgi:hypothetical protein
LRIFDSWNAVVSAMVAARGGISRLTDRAAMSAALAVWSGSKVSVMPDAVMVHLGLTTLE